MYRQRRELNYIKTNCWCLKKKSVTLSLQNHAHDYGFGFTLWQLNKWKRTFNSNYSNIVNIWIPVKNWSTFKTCDNSWYRRLKHPPLLMDLSHISVSSIIRTLGLNSLEEHHSDSEVALCLFLLFFLLLFFFSLCLWLFLCLLLGCSFLKIILAAV